MPALKSKPYTSWDEPDLRTRQKGLQKHIYLAVTYLGLESGANLLSYLFKELGDIEIALRNIEQSKKRIVNDYGYYDY